MAKSWEITFLIRAFGLIERLLIGVGLGFSDKGLKSQKLQLRRRSKNIYIYFFQYSIFSDLSLVYLPNILYSNALNVFSTWKIS